MKAMVWVGVQVGTTRIVNVAAFGDETSAKAWQRQLPLSREIYGPMNVEGRLLVELETRVVPPFSFEWEDL